MISEECGTATAAVAFLRIEKKTRRFMDGCREEPDI